MAEEREANKSRDDTMDVVLEDLEETSAPDGDDILSELEAETEEAQPGFGSGREDDSRAVASAIDGLLGELEAEVAEDSVAEGSTPLRPEQLARGPSRSIPPPLPPAARASAAPVSQPPPPLPPPSAFLESPPIVFPDPGPDPVDDEDEDDGREGGLEDLALPPYAGHELVDPLDDGGAVGVSGLGLPGDREAGSPAEGTAVGLGAPVVTVGVEERLAAFREDLEATDDPAREGRIHYEMARILEASRRDLNAAKQHYAQALERLPENIPALRGSRRVLIALGDARGALPLLDTEARLTAEPSRKAALLFAKGRLLEDRLGDPAGARAAYDTAARLDRGNVSVLKALEQRDRTSLDWEALDATLERQANAVAEDPRHRATLVASRARLWEARENGTDTALELFETALRLDPGSLEALEALERLHQRQGRWRDLIRVLEHRAAQTGDAQVRMEALYRVGRLHADRLGNREEAIHAYERAREHAPKEPLLLDALARLYDRGGRSEELAEVLAVLAEQASDRRVQLSLWHRVGRLRAEDLGQPEAGRLAFERALDLDPAHPPSLDALGRIHEAQEAWEDLVRMLLRAAEAMSDAPRRAAAHARAAAVLETHLERSEDAVAHHLRALALDPRQASSFRALTRLYAADGRWRELVEIHERALTNAERPEDLRAHLSAIGGIYEDRLGEPAQAARAYRRILDTDPSDLQAMHDLQRATERAGRYSELVEALEREAERRSPEDRLGLLCQAAEVLDERLQDTTGAVSRYREVLRADPTHAVALAGLTRIVRRLGRWDDLLDLYRKELEGRPPEHRADLLVEMGRIAEDRLGDEERALALYKEAVEAAPRHTPARQGLARVLAARRRFDELAEVLQHELSTAESPAAKARIAFRLGEVYEQQLADPRRAQSAYEAAISSDEAFTPAREARSRLLDAQGSWRRRVEDLEAEAVATADDARAIAAWTRAGDLWERSLGEPRKACACHERALERDPAHVPSLLALERLYRRLSRRDALAWVYGSLSRTLASPGARVAALRELARIQELEETPAAERRPTYEAILGLAPGDVGALDALEGWALDHGDAALLARVDEQLASATEDPRLAAAYRVRYAEALEEDGDPRALEAFREAVRVDPESLAAVRGLVRVAQRVGAPQDRVAALRREAELVTSVAQAARCWAEAGIVNEEELGDATAAATAYERALELDPDHPTAAERLLALLLQEDRAAQAADRLARAAASAERPARRAALWTEVSAIRADRLGDRPGAIEGLGKILVEDPRHVPTLARLAALEAADGRHQEAADRWEQVVEHTSDADVLRTAHLELAALYGEALGDPAHALGSLQAVLSLVPDDPVALERRASLETHLGDYEEAVRTLRRMAETASTRPARADALTRLAEVEAQRGDKAAAKDAARRAMTILGPEGPAAGLHRQLIAGRADWDAHAEAIAIWLDQPDIGPTARREGHVERARILREELGRPKAAVEALEAAVAVSPDDVDLRRTLAGTLRMAGRFDDSAAELRTLLREHPARPDLWRELRATLEAAGRPTDALRCLEPLTLLGRRAPEEEEEMAARPRTKAAPPLAFDRATLEALYPLHQAPAFVELLRRITPGLGRLYPPDLESLGLTARDRLTDRSSAPIRQVADRVAAVVGAGPFHLYVHRLRSRGVVVELGEPPTIIVPSSVTELPEPQQVFALARPLADLALEVHATDKLTPRELEIVLAATARRVSSRYGEGLTNEEILEDLGRRLFRSLPRRTRRGIEELAEAYVKEKTPDVASLVDGVRVSGLRVALLLADDLGAAVDVLRASERDLQDLDGAALLRAPVVERLLRFWVSPEADAVRRSLSPATA